MQREVGRGLGTEGAVLKPCSAIWLGLVKSETQLDSQGSSDWLWTAGLASKS